MRHSKCICIAVELCWQLEFFTFLVAVLMALDMFQVRGMGQCFEAVLNFIHCIPVRFEGFIGKGCCSSVHCMPSLCQSNSGSPCSECSTVVGFVERIA